MTDTISNGLDRTTYLGSSDAAPAIGVSPWKSALDVYFEKLGEPTNLDNLPIRYGTFNQPFVAKEWELQTGNTVHSCEKHFVHPDHPFIQCHVDYLSDLEDQQAIIEVKTSGRYWDDLPLYYQAQVQQQLACSGLQLAYVPVLFAGRDFKVFEVQANQEVQERMMEKMCVLWVHIQERTPPHPVTPDDVKKLWPYDKGETVEATQEVHQYLAELVKTKQEVKKLQDRQAVLEGSVKVVMKDAAVLVNENGTPLASWKSSKPSTRFNSKKFVSDNPELAEVYTDEVNGSRRFIIKENNL
jgi:putative phage-type endonuclease